jgi:hypothetical protein
MVDLDAVLQRVRRHPSLPEAPPLEEIVARAGRRRVRRGGVVLALAAVLVAAVSVAAAGVGDERAGQRDVASSSARRPVLIPSLTESPASTRPATTRPRPTTTAPATTEPAPATTAVTPTTTRSSSSTTAPRASLELVRSSGVEDTDIGTAAGTVQYSGGSWTRCGGCDVATGDSSYYYGYAAGQSYTVTFRGVELKVYAPSDEHGGVARVTVDGQPAATPTVDFLTSGNPVNGLRWDSGVLPDGVHRVTFTIQPGPNEVVLFDRADVYTG